MPPARSLLCAGLLLLHAVLLSGVAAKKQRGGPRGFQAAKEAERRAAAAAAASGACTAGWCDAGLPELPAGQAALPSCSGIIRPPAAAVPAAQPVWLLLALVAVTAFAAGLLAGAALHSMLLRRRHKQPPKPATARLAAGHADRLLQPAGAEAEDGSKQLAQQPDSTGSRPLAAAAAADAAAAAAKADRPAAVGEGAGETPEVSTAPVASSVGQALAMAAAVQELVLQKSSSSSSAHDQPAASAASSAAAAVAEERQEEQQQEEQEEQQGQPLVPAAVGGDAQSGGLPGPAYSAALPPGGPLTMLQPEDASDVQAAAQLVLTMCRSMHVDPAQLSAGERLQLIHTMLHAWQAQQGRRHAEEMSRCGAGRPAGEMRLGGREVVVPTVLSRLPKASGIHASLHICLRPVAPHPLPGRWWGLQC